ncbi:MAG: hypothetical protein PF637_14385 [Spirochaetes bacterium]|jgi:hypothetical protein|nr:hypothetical protein [Spirochaetota bacterium]
MSAADTNYMEIQAVKVSDNFYTIIYISYLRVDFVSKMLKITVNRKNNIVEQLFFSSNSFGTATWTNDSGIVDAHRWETEDTAQNLSFLAKHYPTLLLNGAVGSDYACNEIIPDVLNALESDNLRNEIGSIVEHNRFDIHFDPLDYDIFVDKLPHE